MTLMTRRNRWLPAALIACLAGATPQLFFADEPAASSEEAAPSEAAAPSDEPPRPPSASKDEKNALTIVKAEKPPAKKAEGKQDKPEEEASADERRKKLWADVDQRRQRLQKKQTPQQTTVQPAPGHKKPPAGKPAAAGSILRQPTRIFNKYSTGSREQPQPATTAPPQQPEQPQPSPGTTDDRSEAPRVNNRPSSSDSATTPPQPAPLRDGGVTAVPLPPRRAPSARKAEPQPSRYTPGSTGRVPQPQSVAPQPAAPQSAQPEPSAVQLSPKRATQLIISDEPTQAEIGRAPVESEPTPQVVETPRMPRDAEGPIDITLGGDPGGVIAPTAPDLNGAGDRKLAAEPQQSTGNELVLASDRPTAVPVEPSVDRSQPSPATKSDTKVVFTVTDDGIESIEVPNKTPTPARSPLVARAVPVRPVPRGAAVPSPSDTANDTTATPDQVVDANGRPRPQLEQVAPSQTATPLASRMTAPIRRVSPLKLDRQEDSAAEGLSQTETPQGERPTEQPMDTPAVPPAPKLAKVDPNDDSSEATSPIVQPGKVLRRPDLIARSEGSSRRKRTAEQRADSHRSPREGSRPLDDRVASAYTPGKLFQPRSVQRPTELRSTELRIDGSRPKPAVASVGEAKPPLQRVNVTPTESEPESSEPPAVARSADPTSSGDLVTLNEPPAPISENSVSENSVSENSVSEAGETATSQESSGLRVVGADNASTDQGATTPSGPEQPKLVEPKVTHHRLQLQVKQSGLLRLPANVAKVQVVNESLCEAILFDNREVSIIAKREGTTHVLLTMEGKSETTNYLIAVTAPQALATQRGNSQDKLAQTIRGLYPSADVSISEEDGRIVVSGEVDSNDHAFKILALVRRVRLVPVVDRLRVR